MRDYELIDAACLLFIGLALLIVWWCGVVLILAVGVVACLSLITG